ncbi:MAG TPA: hypothetical protein RMH99_12495 [Sandaracinaceae bacterium LLY-WYZ-13_1]|nr:hypothetical protein [Sandaracinaceae bacterium LLY-WYZ-13_1]
MEVDHIGLVLPARIGRTEELRHRLVGNARGLEITDLRRLDDSPPQVPNQALPEAA